MNEDLHSPWTSSTVSMERTALALGLCCMTASGMGSNWKTTQSTSCSPRPALTDHSGSAGLSEFSPTPRVSNQCQTARGGSDCENSINFFVRFTHFLQVSECACVSQKALCDVTAVTEKPLVNRWCWCCSGTLKGIFSGGSKQRAKCV